MQCAVRRGQPRQVEHGAGHVHRLHQVRHAPAGPLVAGEAQEERLVGDRLPQREALAEAPVLAGQRPVVGDDQHRRAPGQPQALQRLQEASQPAVDQRHLAGVQRHPAPRRVRERHRRSRGGTTGVTPPAAGS